MVVGRPCDLTVVRTVDSGAPPNLQGWGAHCPVRDPCPYTSPGGGHRSHRLPPHFYRSESYTQHDLRLSPILTGFPGRRPVCARP